MTKISKALQLIDNTIEKVLKQAQTLKKLEAQRADLKLKKKNAAAVIDKEYQFECTENQQQAQVDEKPQDMYAGWIPPELRRPEDEHFDLKSLDVLREQDVIDGVTKLVLQEG